MINPYLCYVIAFTLAFLTYLLGWSSVYPKLSLSLILLLLITILLFAIAAFYTFRSKIITFNRIDASNKLSVLMTLFIFLLWAAEFTYAGGIPLIKILLKQPYDYRTFGIPSLHVFVVTFSSFYTIYLFHVYTSSKSRLIAALFLLNLFAAILIFNRGMLMFNLSACCLLYLLYKKTIGWKFALLATTGGIVLLFIFGVLGSLRVSREGNKPYSNEDFLETGQATTAFRKSIVPKEFFWSYIYISSPLANLQHNITTSESLPLGVTNFVKLITNEVLMDFISKRTNAFLDIQPVQDHRIPGPFNASTVYSRSFSYQGWLGISFMVMVLLLLPLLYFRLIASHSPFFLVGLVTLCTMYLFLAFDNTIRFTGLSFQLVYPILLQFCVERFTPIAKFFVNNKVTS